MKIRSFAVLIYALALFFFNVSCDRNMSVPSYLYIDSAILKTAYMQQGTASANITDVWVTVDGKNMGVYELPATVPLLVSGNVKVQLQAGIKKNGLSSLRPVYPFFSSDIRYLDMKKKSCDTLHPVFTYGTSTQFVYREDFEDAGIKLKAVDSSILITKTSDKKLLFSHPGETNHYSGCIHLKPEDTYFEIQTSVSLKKQLTYAFLEVNYNTTENIEVGIYYHYNGRTIQVPICGVYATGKGETSQWKKIYINLTEAVNASSYVSDYEVYIKGVKTKGNEALYLFDNIKIVNM